VETIYEGELVMNRFFRRGMAYLLAGTLMIQSLLPVQANQISNEQQDSFDVQQSVSANQPEQYGETDIPLPEEYPVDALAQEDIIPEDTAQGVIASEEAEESEVEESEVEGILSEDSGESAPDETATEELEGSDAETTETQTPLSDILLNYLYVEKPYISTPDVQRIVADIGEGDLFFDRATLTYRNYRTGEAFEMEAELSRENPELLLFEKKFTDAKDSGIFQIESITLYAGEETSVIRLAETGIYAYFGVNEEVVTSNDQISDAYELETNIVTFDQNGQPEAATDISEALERAGAQLGDSQLARAGATKKNITVVLDPGHDASHAGAHSGNLKEEDLVLSIAKYCKEELESYSGVTVYMTREGAACPYPGTTSVACNANRVAYAKSVGANVYVSIHLNSGAASAAGAEVYYPNANYNAEIGSQGKTLAESVEKKLVALGLYNRGVKIRNSGDGTTYPDGSLADYYAVIKNSKLNGFPGIIIEHAFVTNPSDAAFLSSDANLKKIGIADAEGIAEYYSLKKGGSAIEFTSDKIVISSVDTLAGTFAVSISDVKPADEVQKVQFRVYTKQDQSDLKVYNAKKQSDGSYKATVYASKHDNVEGTYIIEACAVDDEGNSVQVRETTQDLIPSFKAKLSTEVTGTNNTTYKVSADGISGAESVRFLLYYKKDGKGKGVYYKGKKDKKGVWYANIPLKKLVNEGDYRIYVYATASYGTEKQAGVKTFAYEREISITVKARSKAQKKFRITTEGLAYASKVEYEVYSVNGGKDDLATYKAAKNEEGEWVYDVAVNKHKTDGKYYAIVYATVGGKRIKVGKQTFNVSGPTDAKVTVTRNDSKATMTVNIKNVSSVSGIRNVSVKVWTRKDKSDAKTFEAKLKKDAFTATIKLSKFNYYYGKYYMEVSATDNNKITKIVGTKRLTMQQPSADMSVTLNKAKTKYSITLSDISFAGNVEIRVWSKAEGKKAMKKYKAKKDSDGNWSYTLPIKKFTDTGKHYVKAYATIGGSTYPVGSYTIKSVGADLGANYEIMGDGSVTLNQLIKYYQANATYPSFYKNSDAPTLKKFCQLYIKECEAEGVKVEVAFAQAMKETNFLKYGGDVSIEQYNFAGIGATGNGAPGNSFANVQTGIRAQVQHLKAYASTEPLVHKVVDPRFQYVTRGICPYVEWLGINENPKHVGWATAVGYGTNIVERISKLKSY